RGGRVRERRDHHAVENDPILSDKDKAVRVEDLGQELPREYEAVKVVEVKSSAAAAAAGGSLSGTPRTVALPSSTASDGGGDADETASVASSVAGPVPGIVERRQRRTADSPVRPRKISTNRGGGERGHSVNPRSRLHRSGPIGVGDIISTGKGDTVVHTVKHSVKHTVKHTVRGRSEDPSHRRVTKSASPLPPLPTLSSFTLGGHETGACIPAHPGGGASGNGDVGGGSSGSGAIRHPRRGPLSSPPSPTNSSSRWGLDGAASVAADFEAAVAESMLGVAAGEGEGGEGNSTISLEDHPQRSRLHQMVAALTDLCLYLMGVSPLTVVDSEEMLKHLPMDDWDEDGSSSLFSGGTSEGSGSARGTGGGEAVGTATRPQRSSPSFKIPSSYGKVSSIATQGMGASPGGAALEDPEEEEDDDLGGRWGPDGVVVGGGDLDGVGGQQEAVGPLGDVIRVSDILKGWAEETGASTGNIDVDGAGGGNGGGWQGTVDHTRGGVRRQTNMESMPSSSGNKSGSLAAKAGSSSGNSKTGVSVTSVSKGRDAEKKSVSDAGGDGDGDDGKGRG
ncbi:unnamed protein product, partial [Choristocarpus tenellus]